MAARAELDSLLVALVDAGVEFIVVGGVAAFIQGSELATIDLDIVHRRSEANVARLRSLLETLDAHVRGQPARLPSDEAFSGPGHQLLATPFADLDILGAIEGELGFDELIEDAERVRFRGRELRVLSLDQLISLKEGSPREKDRIALAYLRAAKARKSHG